VDVFVPQRVGQHERVEGVRLGCRQSIPFPGPGGNLRRDAEQLQPGRLEVLDQQSLGALDSDSQPPPLAGSDQDLQQGPQPRHVMFDAGHLTQHPAVKAWLAEHRRITVHFTPTHASWMNLVEVWFSIAERQAIHRGTFDSVRDLTRKIRTFVDGWNNRSHPFTWTKTPDEVLAKANRKKTSDAAH
jgi:hypothetical protein